MLSCNIIINKTHRIFNDFLSLNLQEMSTLQSPRRINSSFNCILIMKLVSHTLILTKFSSFLIPVLPESLPEPCNILNFILCVQVDSIVLWTEIKSLLKWLWWWSIVLPFFEELEQSWLHFTWLLGIRCYLLCVCSPFRHGHQLGWKSGCCTELSLLLKWLSHDYHATLHWDYVWKND